MKINSPILWVTNSFLAPFHNTITNGVPVMLDIRVAVGASRLSPMQRIIAGTLFPSVVVYHCSGLWDIPVADIVGP